MPDVILKRTTHKTHQLTESQTAEIAEAIVRRASEDNRLATIKRRLDGTYGELSSLGRTELLSNYVDHFCRWFQVNAESTFSADGPEAFDVLVA